MGTLSMRELYRPTSWEHLDNQVEWWGYFKLYTYSDGKTEVFDAECERPWCSTLCLRQLLGPPRR